MSNKKPLCESWKRHSSVHRGFKSPLISRASGHSQSGGEPSLATFPSTAQGSMSQPTSSEFVDNERKRLQKDVDRLTEELKDTEDQIQQLKDSGIEESELAEYISKLHEYNDLKDIAQMVIGNIANVRGVRTRDLYSAFGLQLDD